MDDLLLFTPTKQSHFEKKTGRLTKSFVQKMA